MKKRSQLSLLAFLAGIICLLSPLPSNARGQAATTAQTATGTTKKTAKPAANAQEITDAKGKGLVWVNTSTRVYHGSSSSLYGKTAHGKFMTEDDAKKAGYRAGREGNGSKKQPAHTPAPAQK